MKKEQIYPCFMDKSALLLLYTNRPLSKGIISRVYFDRNTLQKYRYCTLY